MSGFDRLTATARASVATLWPDSADKLAREVAEFAGDEDGRIRHQNSRGEGAFNRSWRDNRADFTLSELDGLILADHEVKVERWPSDAAHDGERMSNVAGDLQESGYECFYPAESYCRRGFDELRAALRGDRIVTADFLLVGGESLRKPFLGIVAATVLVIDADPVPPAGGSIPLRVRVGAPLTGTLPL